MRSRYRLAGRRAVTLSMVAVVVGGALAGCSPSPSATRATCATGSVTLAGDPGAPAISVRTCRGISSHGNGAWIVEQPTGYAAASRAGAATRTLILYSHGLRAEGSANHTAQDYPTGLVQTYGPATRYLLLAAGYALAGSAYGSNGWAVTDGVKADVELLTSIAPAQLSVKPRKTFAVGSSLGGLVTEELAEEHPSLITAANPECGVLAGSLAAGDITFSDAVAAKVFFDPSLQLSGYASAAAAALQLKGLEVVLASRLANPTTRAATVESLIGLDLMFGLPLKTFEFNAEHSAASLVGAATESFLTQVELDVEDLHDVEARSGGMPVTNVGLDYAALATPAVAAQFAGFGYPSSALASYAQLLQRKAARIPADPAARRVFAQMGVPTGDLKVPTLTMHDEDDPAVIVANETVFAHLVAAQHKSKLLQQIFIAPPPGATYGLNSTTAAASETPAAYGAGHCNFTPSQVVANVKALDEWTTTGVRPTATLVATLVRAIDALLPLRSTAPAAAVDPSYPMRAWPLPRL